MLTQREPTPAEPTETAGAVRAAESTAPVTVTTTSGNTGLAEPPVAPIAEVPSASRMSLVHAVFKALDADVDGKLNEAEMRRFAEQTGFDGSSEDWAEEYTSLCAENGCNGSIDVGFFAHLVNDSSNETGCYCSDNELQSMLASLGSEAKPANQIQSITSVGAAVVTRSELIHATFQALDVNGDGKLDQQEMRIFAEHIGFKGDDEAWIGEYTSLCSQSDSGKTSTVDAVLFAKLVDNTSADSYCADEKLHSILAKLGSAAVDGRAQADGRPGSSCASEGQPQGQ